MHSLIFEISERNIPKNVWTTEEDFYDSYNTYWDYMKKLDGVEREEALDKMQEMDWFKILFDNGKNKGEIIYNGKIDEAKKLWYKMIQKTLDKTKDANTAECFELKEAVERGIFGYCLFCLPDWSGSHISLPCSFLEWIEWLDRNKGKQTLYVNSIFDYHF